MTKEEAINTVLCGKLIECSADQWPKIRVALHEYAGKQIDSNQDIYAHIALMEIKRLDEKFKSK